MNIDPEMGMSLEMLPDQGEVRDRAVALLSSIEFCWTVAVHIFGDKATPETAMWIYDRWSGKENPPLLECVPRTGGPARWGWTEENGKTPCVG